MLGAFFRGNRFANYQTLIKAFYDGIPLCFTSKLKETSCSTWTAAQQNFRECNTRANVQLAQQAAALATANKPTENRHWDHKKSEQPEGKRALTATKVSTPSTKPPQQVKAEVASGTEFLDTGQSYTGKYCSNCRGQHPTDACPKLPCFVYHEFEEPSHHKQSDCLTEPVKRRPRRKQHAAAHGKSNFWLATMTPKIRSIRMTFLTLEFFFYSYSLYVFFSSRQGGSTLRSSATILDSHLFQI